MNHTSIFSYFHFDSVLLAILACVTCPAAFLFVCLDLLFVCFVIVFVLFLKHNILTLSVETAGVKNGNGIQSVTIHILWPLVVWRTLKWWGLVHVWIINMGRWTIEKCYLIHMSIIMVFDQNGVSRLHIVVEMHHSGRKPLIMDLCNQSCSSGQVAGQTGGLPVIFHGKSLTLVHHYQISLCAFQPNVSYLSCL